MKAILKYIPGLLILPALLFFACDNDDDKDPVATTLVINAKKGNKDSAFYEGSFVRIYETADDMYSGQNIFLEGETSKDMNATVSFTDIAPARYYLYAAGHTGASNLERYDSVDVPANQVTVKDLVLKVIKNNGNLKVFARKGISYFENATVNIYLSDQDRTNNIIFKTSITEAHGSAESDNYAYFSNLDPRKYYIKVTYQDGSKTLTGTEDGGNGVYVPKGVTINTHVPMSE